MNQNQNSKKKTETQPAGSENGRKEEAPGFSVILGVVLLAGALFNVPSILKTPETTADKMMLVIVLAMALGGAVLLFFRKKK